MRQRLAAPALVHQRQALIDAEPVLFVDDDQRQALIFEALLKQCVRADDDLGSAVPDGRIGLVTRGFSEATRQPGDADAERLQPGRKAVAVLFCQQLCRRHDCNLVPFGHDVQRSGGGHDRFAAADITLHQAHHRMRRLQIGLDLAERFLLATGQCERQRSQEAVAQFGAAGQRNGRAGPVTQPDFSEAQVMGEHFLERQAPLARMCAGRQFVQVGIRRRPMQRTDRRREVGQARPGREFGRYPVRDLGQAVFDGLVHEIANPALLQSFGQRVDRRQTSLRTTAAPPDSASGIPDE